MTTPLKVTHIGDGVCFCRCCLCGYATGNVVTAPPPDAACPRCGRSEVVESKSEERKEV